MDRWIDRQAMNLKNANQITLRETHLVKQMLGSRQQCCFQRQFSFPLFLFSFVFCFVGWFFFGRGMRECKTSMLPNGKQRINRSWSLSLLSLVSQQPYSMLRVACLRQGRGSGSGVFSRRDLARCFGFGSMPAQVMLILSVSGFLLPSAVFRFSLNK